MTVVLVTYTLTSGNRKMREPSPVFAYRKPGLMKRAHLIKMNLWHRV